MNKKKKVIIIIIAILFALMALVLMRKNKMPTPNVDTPKDNQTTYVKYPNIDKYFDEKAEIISVIPVKESKDVLSEKEVIEELKYCGFKDVEVTAEYTINGEYLESDKISEESNEKHPVYTIQYITPNGDYWTINIINSQFIATPVSYQLQSESTTSVLIADNENITSYDSVGNRFFITKPKEDSITIKTVSKIDATTIDGLTVGDIERL